MKISRLSVLLLFTSGLYLFALGRPGDEGITIDLINKSDGWAIGHFFSNEKAHNSIRTDENLTGDSIDFKSTLFLTGEANTSKDPLQISISLIQQANYPQEMLQRIWLAAGGKAVMVFLTIKDDKFSFTSASNNIFLVLDKPNIKADFESASEAVAYLASNNLTVLATKLASTENESLLKKVVSQSCQTLLNLKEISNLQIKELEKIGRNHPSLQATSLKFRLLAGDISAVRSAVSLADSLNPDSTDKSMLGIAFVTAIQSGKLSRANVNLEEMWTAFGKSVKSSIVDLVVDGKKNNLILKLALKDENILVRYLAVSKAIELSHNLSDLKRPSFSKFRSNEDKYISMANSLIE